jgi:hypothetical protein
VGLIVKNAWPMQIEISNAIARLLRNCSAHLTIMLDDSPNSGLYLKIIHNLKTCWTISLRAILWVVEREIADILIAEWPLAIDRRRLIFVFNVMNSRAKRQTSILISKKDGLR